MIRESRSMRVVVVLCGVFLLGSVAGHCTQAQDQEQTQAQSKHKSQMSTQNKSMNREPAAEADSAMQDIPDDPVSKRSKTCWVSLDPPASCVSAVSHRVGDSCTCKVGDVFREGRYLNR